MNSNPNTGKLFIIGWSVGLLASVIFLWRALFESDPSTTIEQPIITGAVIEQLSGNQDQVTTLVASWDIDNSIDILIPEIMASIALANIVKQAETDNNIQIRIWISTGQSYPDKERIKILSWQYDIIVLPSEKLTEYSDIAGKMEMGESLRPFVHASFGQIVENNKFSYIPIGLDPFITRTHKDSTLNTNSISTLFNQIALRTQNKKLWIPLLFGADTEDINTWKEWSETYPHQLFFIYTIFNDIITSLDTSGLKSLIDVVNYKTASTRDSNNFKELIKRIWDRDVSCKQYPDICIRTYNFATARFGFLSDTYYLQKYFNTQDTEPVVGPFIAKQNSYPTRARWAIVHKKTQNLISSMQFLNTLLSVSIQSWNRQAPLINPYNGQADISNIKRFDNQRDRQKIIRYSDQIQTQLIDQTPLTDLLQNNYNTNLFMQVSRPKITF